MTPNSETVCGWCAGKKFVQDTEGVIWPCPQGCTPAPKPDECQRCIAGKCTARVGCVACSNPVVGADRERAITGEPYRLNQVEHDALGRALQKSVKFIDTAAITGEPKKIIHGMWRDRFDRERYDYRDPKVSDRRAAPITGESRDIAP